MVVVVLEAALGPVGLGTTGRPLLLTASTAVYAVTGALFLGRPAQRPATSMTLLALMAAAALVMHAADPDGPVIGLFLVAAFAPLARVMAALEDSQAAQRAAAAEAERARLAADVHDVLAHTLSGLALQTRGRHPAGGHDADRPPAGGGRTASPPALPQRPHRGTPRRRRAARRPAAGAGRHPRARRGTPAGQRGRRRLPPER